MYTNNEFQDQSKIAKIIGNLISPEPALIRFNKSGLEDWQFFAKQGELERIFLTYKTDLEYQLSIYRHKNLLNFLDRQKERITEQATILHNSVSALLPKLYLIEAKSRGGEQPTIEDKQVVM